MTKTGTGEATLSEGGLGIEELRLRQMLEGQESWGKKAGERYIGRGRCVGGHTAYRRQLMTRRFSGGEKPPHH